MRERVPRRRVLDRRPRRTATTNGFFYFAGRTADWIRVDGENFAAAPVERILLRWDPMVLPAVYGVPDPELGDRVMAAIQLAPGVEFDADAFVAFLERAARPRHEVGAHVRADRRRRSR